MYGKFYQYKNKAKHWYIKIFII